MNRKNLSYEKEGYLLGESKEYKVFSHKKKNIYPKQKGVIANTTRNNL
jgi:hypothetical protein